MDTQQLVTKVSQLESRVSTLEDEGKIIKGEVKQVLTEIRSTILVRDNPFEGDSGSMSPSAQVSVVAPAQPAKVELVLPQPPQAPAPVAQQPTLEPAHPPMATALERSREPVPLRPQAPPAPARPQWSLLTIAGLAAWAEDAMRRIGALRLEILLDLCEAAGHLSPEARTALARVTELDVPEPAREPSTNETAALLRQLDALVNDADDERDAIRLRRIA